MKVVCMMEDALSNTEVKLSKRSEKEAANSADEILISTSSGMEICLDADELRKALDTLTGKNDIIPITLPGYTTPWNDGCHTTDYLKYGYDKVMCSTSNNRDIEERR